MEHLLKCSYLTRKQRINKCVPPQKFQLRFQKVQQIAQTVIHSLLYRVVEINLTIKLEKKNDHFHAKVIEAEMFYCRPSTGNKKSVGFLPSVFLETLQAPLHNILVPLCGLIRKPYGKSTPVACMFYIFVDQAYARHHKERTILSKTEISAPHTMLRLSPLLMFSVLQKLGETCRNSG